jgi:plasmid stability protein
MPALDGIARKRWHSATTGPKQSGNMPRFGVRQLDEGTVARLRARAASHSVSMEEEARRILKEAVSASERIGDLAFQLFGSRHGVDLDLPQRAPHEPIDLRERSSSTPT